MQSLWRTFGKLRPAEASAQFHGAFIYHDHRPVQWRVAFCGTVAQTRQTELQDCRPVRTNMTVVDHVADTEFEIGNITPAVPFAEFFSPGFAGIFITHFIKQCTPFDFARKHVFRFYYDPSFPADQVHQVCPFQDQWFIGICGAMLFKVSFQFIKAQAAGGGERLFVLFLQIWAVVCEFFHVVT